MKLLKVDWDQLEDAFRDASNEHRYYLDRETGVVHFFSSYLDNDEEQEDERKITSEARYVSIPLSLRLVSARELNEFVGQLTDRQEKKVLLSTLRAKEAYDRFSAAIESLPSAQEKWLRFHGEFVRRRVKLWLSEVGVEPMTEG